MTAGELITRVDELRPNTYGRELKLRWLRRLDSQIAREIQNTHPGLPQGELAEPYEPDTELTAPFPYDEELYTAYLFCQIDLHNGEISKYNQSLALLAAAWRQLADWVNRTQTPGGVTSLKF